MRRASALSSDQVWPGSKDSLDRVLKRIWPSQSDKTERLLYDIASAYVKIGLQNSKQSGLKAIPVRLSTVCKSHNVRRLQKLVPVNVKTILKTHGDRYFSFRGERCIIFNIAAVLPHRENIPQTARANVVNSAPPAAPSSNALLEANDPAPNNPVMPNLTRGAGRLHQDTIARDGVALPMNVDLSMTIEEGSCQPVFHAMCATGDKAQDGDMGQEDGSKMLTSQTTGLQASIPLDDHANAATTAPSSPAVLRRIHLDQALQSLLPHLMQQVSTYIQQHSVPGAALCVSSCVSSLVVEVVADVGRRWLLRYSNGDEEHLPVVADMKSALKALGVQADGFHNDNRLGLDGTLHRISAIRGRNNDVVGLTYRVGRHIPGLANLLLDVLYNMAMGHKDDGDTSEEYLTPSLLILGPPGVGKTTLLRDVARCFADRLKKRVVVVDTSNEICGDGDVPHDGIGSARRMPIPPGRKLHDVLIEAVQNHNPQVVVVDEIGSSKAVAAVRTIAQRGVIVCGTAHGTNLTSLIRNPELNSLVGGVQSVTLGDKAARVGCGGVKTRSERAGAPVFGSVVEALSCTKWRLHTQVGVAVDALLRGGTVDTQLRQYNSSGGMVIRFERK